MFYSLIVKTLMYPSVTIPTYENFTWFETYQYYFLAAKTIKVIRIHRT